ncbi:MAG: tRNA lysidine(34) synthetase TilS [Verrucomicrobiota bacterium]|jgi:tRNA(Ile)-lysidine synthase
MTDLPADFLDAMAEMPSGTAFLGFSGGADSLCLAECLFRTGRAFTAVHFQHGARGAAAEADAEFCRSWTQQRGVPFVQRDLSVPQKLLPGEAFEEAARRLRLAAWQEIAAGSAVFLAHHADDQVENLLLRLCRGSSSSGLRGMRPTHKIGEVTFCRPLLDLTRLEIEAFLRTARLEWRHDASNDEAFCRRNLLRLEILPKLDAAAALRKTQKRLGEDADFIESEARRYLAEKPLDNARFAEAAPALRSRLLRFWLAARGYFRPLPESQIQRLGLEAGRSSPRQRKIPLEAGFVLIIGIRGDWDLSIPLPESRIWDWTKQHRCRFGEWELELSHEGEGQALALDPGLPLSLRCPQSGDALLPAGRRSPRRVAQILADARIPAAQRATWPLLEQDGQLIAVAGHAVKEKGAWRLRILSLRAPP